MSFVPTPQGGYKLLSIHTPYVDKIRERTKKHELRGYNPGVRPGDWCIIYETSPTKHIATVFRALGTWCLPVDLAWQRHHHQFGIGEEAYRAYFTGKTLAYGVEIDTVSTFDPIPLGELAQSIRFFPPQGVRSWTYKSIHQRILDAID